MGGVTLHVPAQRKISSEGTPPCSIQAAGKSNPKELSEFPVPSTIAAHIDRLVLMRASPGHRECP